MAAGAHQRQLSGDGFPAHLTTDPDSRKGEDYEIDPERGLFYCKPCGRRITRNTKNHNEYGHATSCDYHETFDGGIR